MNPVTSPAPAPPAVDGRGISTFWSLRPEEVLRRLGSGKQGLTSEEARRRLALQGASLLRPQGRHGGLALLLSQFKSPIILILVAAAGLSASLGQRTDALIILAIVLGSGLLGFWQERGAADAVEALLARVRIKAAVIRDGRRSKSRPRRSCRGISSCSTPATSSRPTAWSWSPRTSISTRRP